TYWARVLAAFGTAGLDADALTGWSHLAERLRHLALPLATLTLIGIGGTARFVRGAMRDVLSQPFVRAARAKGLSPFQVTRRHVTRNALIPVVTLLGLSLPALFSGTVFVEAVFAWPGVGRRLVEAVRARDYPVVMGATVVGAGLVVVGHRPGRVDAPRLWGARLAGGGDARRAAVDRARRRRGRGSGVRTRPRTAAPARAHRLRARVAARGAAARPRRAVAAQRGPRSHRPGAHRLDAGRAPGAGRGALARGAAVRRRCRRPRGVARS